MGWDELTTEQRRKLAILLAEERLPIINQKLSTVQPSKTLYARYIKRVIDVIVSGIGLLVTLPINCLIGIITFFDVGRPIFFKQERIGKDEKPFTLIKFRNMRNDRDENGDLLPASIRVTKFGRFVRKTSLDELLNLWSVFKGDMSLIGPRPCCRSIWIASIFGTDADFMSDRAWNVPRERQLTESGHGRNDSRMMFGMWKI